VNLIALDTEPIESPVCGLHVVVFVVLQDSCGADRYGSNGLF